MRTTETFTPAVAELKSMEAALRLDAIYALERIARSNESDHWPVIEALTAFARERAPVERKALNGSTSAKAKPAVDIQAVLSVLGRRTQRSLSEEAGHRLDLRDVDLTGIRLKRGENHFRFALFGGTCLAQADLRGAEFVSANLQNSDLSNANLRKADLRGAFLEGAKLPGANLRGASLGDASLYNTDLRQVNLRSAALTDANLRAADLTGADLRRASLSIGVQKGPPIGVE